MGFSGAPTTAKVPFTLSNSKMGPREWLADTVSKMKSRVLLAACHQIITKSLKISTKRFNQWSSLGCLAHFHMISQIIIFSFFTIVVEPRDYYNLSKLLKRKEGK